MRFDDRSRRRPRRNSPDFIARTVARLTLLAFLAALLAGIVAQSHYSGSFGFWPAVAAQEKANDRLERDAPGAGDQAQDNSGQVAYRFDVPLPISDPVERSVTRRVEQALRKLPQAGPRPIFIFQFSPPKGTAGEGSSFGDALDLARFLSGDRLSLVRTVAWVPLSVGTCGAAGAGVRRNCYGQDAELGAAWRQRAGTIDDTLRARDRNC
jgi:hypothetical protein